MPIQAECTECRNRFRLQDDLADKPMRCPVCREIFTVRAVPEGPANPSSTGTPPTTDSSPPSSGPGRTRTDAPNPQFRTGHVGDFVPVLGAAAPTPVPGTERPVVPPAPKSVAPIEVRWSPELESGTTGTADTSGTRIPPAKRVEPVEVRWTPDADPAVPVPAAARPTTSLDSSNAFVSLLPATSVSSTGSKPPRSSNQADMDPSPRRRSKRRLGLLLFMLTMLVGAGITGGIMAKRYFDAAPDRLNTAANKEYDANRFDIARKLYEQLIREHPDSTHTPRARFLAELCGVRGAVNSVLNRSDPTPAVQLWDAFLLTVDKPEAAKFAAKDGFADDIFDTAKRLTQDLLEKGHEVFKQEAPDEAETWLKRAEGVEAVLDRFRSEGQAKPQAIYAGITGLRRQIVFARDRAVSLREIDQVLKDPDDDKIARARKLASERGLERDDGFATRLAAAEKAIQGKAGYVAAVPPIAPGKSPDPGPPTLLFAPRLDASAPRFAPGTPAVFMASARGTAYALDENDGRILWAARIGLDNPIAPLFLPGNDRHAELVVLIHSGRTAGISVRTARDGRIIWYQTLPGRCSADPVIVGDYLFVPIGDSDGSIVEFNLLSGERTGSLRIGRPIGAGIAHRAGTGQLFVPAEARAVYVFDCDRRGPNGDRTEPILLGVIETNHPAGSLKCAPVFSNPEPEVPGPKHVILSQADSFDSMRLRGFSIPAEGKFDSVVPTADIPLPGWAGFPVVGDGEKLAVVTDRGEFALFGLQLSGNLDTSIFALPTPDRTIRPDRPIRGQVVTAGESMFWIAIGGRLQQYRLGVNGKLGLRMVPYGSALEIGEPIMPTRRSPRGDTVCLVTQKESSIRATLVDTNSGAMIWQRELGLTVKGDPARAEQSIYLLDPSGGIFRVDIGQVNTNWEGERVLDQRLMAMPPIERFRSATELFPAGRDRFGAILTAESDKGIELLIRVVGAVSREVRVPAPAMPAGRPIMMGKYCVIPLNDGTMYRIDLMEGKALEEGPTWRAERAGPGTTCLLAAINDDDFVATDGNRGLVKWHWESKTKLFEPRGRLMLSERPAAAPVITGDPQHPQMVLIDVRNNLTLWNLPPDSLPDRAVRFWRSDAKGALPAGPLKIAPRLVGPIDSTRSLLVGIDRKLFRIDLDSDNPVWSTEVGSDPRAVVSGSSLHVTERKGTIRSYAWATGLPEGPPITQIGELGVAASAIGVGGNRFLVPLFDGTIVLGSSSSPVPEKP